MITFLIGALVGLIFLAGYLINSKTPNSANALVKPKEETAPEEKGPKSLTSTKRSNELPCEVNPLERVFQLFNQLPEIKTKTLKYLRERAQVERFENIIQEIGFELEEFDVEPCVESLLSFAPVHTGHSFRLESKLNEYSLKIVDLFQSLPNKPGNAELMLAYLRAFKRTTHLLEAMMLEYEDVQSIPLTNDLVETLIVNDIKILSDEKLCKVEIEKFFTLFYALKSYLALEPILEVSLQEICGDLDRILEVLYEAKTKYTRAHLVTIEQVQQSLLLNMRSYTNYYEELFSGVHSCIDSLKSSNLKEVVHLMEVLQNVQICLEEEYLVVAQSFSERHGTLESDFHKYLQKLTLVSSKSSEPQTLSVGTLESSVAYFQKRSEDMRFLQDPKPVKSVHNIFESVKQRIQRFKTAKTKEDIDSSGV